MFHAIQESIQCDLPDDQSAEPALVVDVVRVPLPEQVIGTAVAGMAEVVGPRIDGKLVQQVHVEARFRPYLWIGLGENFEPPGDEIMIAAEGDSGPLDEDRQGPNSLVVLGLPLTPTPLPG